MSIIANNLLQGDEGYNISRSLRFRSSASAYLSRTPASVTNRKTWTYSTWIKRGELGNKSIFGAGVDGNNLMRILFGNNIVTFLDYSSGTYQWLLLTTQEFRDPSAWYHFVFSVDTTQATSSNRVKIYVNGVQVTALGSPTYPTQNYDSRVNYTYSHFVGASHESPAQYFDGYMADVVFVDGQSLTPSSFGETDVLTGVWKAKKYGGTYGTNGFYLPFSDNTSTTTLGYDKSGNSNNWTTNNISLTAGTTYDSMTDVPTLTSTTTANYCVMNPLDTTGAVITNGNLRVTTPGSGTNTRATFAVPTTGKYYFEATDVVTGGNNIVGLANISLAISSNLYLSTGAFYEGMFDNAVFGFAVNFDALTYTVYKNNSVSSSGSLTSGITYGVFVSTSGSGGASTALNFGQQPFTYTPPTGFVALNTFNLPEPSIKAGNKYMDATTYTGTGADQNITTLNFEPSFTWIKNRASAYDHYLYDAVRGGYKKLSSNTTDAEATQTNGLSAFLSNGFSLVGNRLNVNESGSSHVAWNWKANGTGSSNTAGTITSTVSANTSAGFSIATYTGNGTSGATVGHGLGVAPKMVIVKSRSNNTNWPVWHTVTAGNNMFLNATDAASSTNYRWSGTPSSTTFGISSFGDVNTNGATYVAYCFAEVAGYSKFGSYTGNGSTDGTFVHLGFRPRYVLIKSTVEASNWLQYDTARVTYNKMDTLLYPSLSNAENTDSTYAIDILSNGFKIRGTGQYGGLNNNGNAYVYACFAENPFKYSLAR